jgi:hypothetical protein
MDFVSVMAGIPVLAVAGSMQQGHRNGSVAPVSLPLGERAFSSSLTSRLYQLHRLPEWSSAVARLAHRPKRLSLIAFEQLSKLVYFFSGGATMFPKTCASEQWQASRSLERGNDVRPWPILLQNSVETGREA